MRVAVLLAAGNCHVGQQVNVKVSVRVMRMEIVRNARQHGELRFNGLVLDKKAIQRGIACIVCNHVVKCLLPALGFVDGGGHAVVPYVGAQAQFLAPGEHFFVGFCVVAAFNNGKACLCGLFKSLATDKFGAYPVPEVDGVRHIQHLKYGS